MPDLVTLLHLLTAISGISCLFFWLKKNKRVLHFLRPFTTILILLTGITGNQIYSTHDYLVFSGLVLCVAGDVLQLYPKRFLTGSVSFAAAILLFSVVAMQSPGPYFSRILVIPVLTLFLFFIFVFIRKAGNLKIPLIIYAMIMANFLLQSAGRAWYIAESGTGYLFLGALLFAISGTVIVRDRFVKKSKNAPLIYMPLYWLSLVFIVNATF
jgi:uncharacterized membrane protein YhhN